MRTIGLTAKRFEMMYEGCLATPRGFTGPSETRIMGSILNKLEAVAHQETVNGVPTYRMNGDVVNPDLKLTDEEYNLAFDSLKAVKWMGMAARAAADLFEAFEKAQVS